MAGMGPPPNPNARRRNARPGVTLLPREGYRGPVPAWPLPKASKAEAAAWEKAWRRPQAAAWADTGLEEVVARYVRFRVRADQPRTSTAALLSEVRQMEDRLGLSAMAMLRLRWELVSNEVAEQRQEPVRRADLRAVDAAGG